MEDNQQQTPNQPEQAGSHAPTSVGQAFRERKQKNEIGEAVEIGGNTFMVARPSLASLTKAGIIPKELATEATNVQTKISKDKDLSSAEIEKYQKYQEELVMASVRVPKLHRGESDYDNNVINITELTDEELNELHIFIQGGGKALRSFRLQRERQIAGLGSDKVSES